MAAAQSPTRAKFIATTAELLHSHGYHATGLNQIIAASGAPRGSLYYHFPGGKDELVAAALQHSGARIDTLLESLAVADDLKRTAQNIFEYFSAALQSSNFQKGCPIAATALEISPEQAALQTIITEIQAGWLDRLSRLIATQSSLDADKARNLAGLLFSLLEGALLQARMQLSVAPLLQACALCQELLPPADPH
ncbi:MAG: TetR/AcrR family transcriptional regulator [Leptospiraceae bacterium]|nr:TetR/AcrR family transcriptional regulator [Leptospiraceae bacterium]